MEWLNYHHLLYFWLTVKTGGVTEASEELRLSQSTVSAQIRALERALDEKLFRRQGRRLVPTDTGQTVFRYADEIFALGREMVDTVKDRPTGRPLRLNVGVADVLPKLVAHRLLAPALELDVPVRLVCSEGKPATLLAELALHRLDVVLSDVPADPGVALKVFTHLLGECDVALVAAPALAAKHRRGFPRSLGGAPLLLPAPGSALRRGLDQWLEGHDLRPRVVGEFEDSALMQAFGREGVGIVPVPSVVERAVARQYGMRVIARLPDVRERFYAISAERRLKHPAVVAISSAAKRGLV
ncbi:MAG: transcriptional activator NhaR [Deltaproteobacteria bacterium]|nr:transcriptional activator NhaR [Deltaproteobacteria bacterium]